MTLHEISGQGFTHQLLWNSAKALLAQPETGTPTDGYFRMAGMLMAYFAFEAYMNLAGSRVDPQRGRTRKNFSTRIHIEELAASSIGYAKKLESNLKAAKDYIKPFET